MIDDTDQQLSRQSKRIASVGMRCRQQRILSTLPYTKVNFWNRCVESYPLRKDLVAYILGLLRRAPKYDMILLTGGERADLFYLAIAGLLPWIHTPHVVADAHWQKAQGAAYVLQRAVFFLGRRLTAQVQPHSDEEVDIYHHIYGIPRSALKAVPWSSTLIGHDVSNSRPDEEGNFMLTGGKSFRDYDVLFGAFKEFELRLEVGIPDSPDTRKLIEKWRAASNVHFFTNWSNDQFIRKMAGCRAFLMPIAPGLTRSTADQSIVNAMYFGKIVIATNSISSRIYIRHGVNGFLVPEKSVEAWKHAIREVLSLPTDVLVLIGRRAAYDARVHFNENLRLVRTLEAALNVLQERGGIDAAPKS